MKQYIPAFALALLVACSSGGDTPVDDGNGNGNGDPDPTPVPLPEAVEQAMETCGFANLEAFLRGFEAFSDAIQPPGDTSIFEVVTADPVAGLFDLAIDLGPLEPPPGGPLTINDPETGLAPESVDLSAFTTSLDGLAAALAESTGDISLLLLITAGEGAPAGTMLATMTDGAVTSFEVFVDVLGPTCSMTVQAVDVAPTAFDGAYPNLSFDAGINLQIGDDAVRGDAVFTLDGSEVASVEVTIENVPPFTLLVNLDTGAVTLAP